MVRTYLIVPLQMLRNPNNVRLSTCTTLECVYLLLFRRHNRKFIYTKLHAGSRLSYCSLYIIDPGPRSMANVTYFRFLNDRLTKSYNTITIQKLLLHAHLLLLRLLYILYFYFMITAVVKE